jgi:hypothetical protein
MKYFVLCLCVFGITVTAATPNRIGNLGGCFTVSYRFVEDGRHDYEIKQALEWITVHAKDGVQTIQHYGLFEDEIMKHFYEEWSEDANNVWQQKVFGPSGNFRYLCQSPDRMGQFRCASKAAPKPLRDIKRRDYNVLNRGTTIQITPAGWVQLEINDKVKTDGTVVATEVGWIEYRRISDEKPCAKAKELFPQR